MIIPTDLRFQAESMGYRFVPVDRPMQQLCASLDTEEPRIQLESELMSVSFHSLSQVRNYLNRMQGKELIQACLGQQVDLSQEDCPYLDPPHQNRS